MQLAEELKDKLDQESFRQQLTPKLEALLTSVNERVEEYEKVQFLAVVREDWDTANDFLTPTLKIKRNVVESAYGPFLDKWYESGSKVIWPD